MENGRKSTACFLGMELKTKIHAIVAVVDKVAV